RISKEKGVEELINSFLDAKLININLDIIGDGPSYKYLVDRYGNFKNIKFLGPMSNKETLEFIAGCRAVVTATKLYEGQPTFLAEASLFGIPSIFPNTGGVSEFFPSDYPLMFEQFDYADLKNKLQLIENEKFVEQLGKLNKKYVDENFNEPQILKKFKDVI
ncbi:glycosyltransferase family 4 protein, partial [Acidimicrobiaceae bacterium]|nr:glycosyltransferase family 4 protein [Acidimicrobiaceae bacterium]